VCDLPSGCATVSVTRSRTPPPRTPGPGAPRSPRRAKRKSWPRADAQINERHHTATSNEQAASSHPATLQATPHGCRRKVCVQFVLGDGEGCMPSPSGLAVDANQLSPVRLSCTGLCMPGCVRSLFVACATTCVCQCVLPRESVQCLCVVRVCTRARMHARVHAHARACTGARWAERPATTGHH